MTDLSYVKLAFCYRGGALNDFCPPIKLLISPLPEMINQICKKYSLENPQDKKTSDDTCDIFQK